MALSIIRTERLEFVCPEGKYVARINFTLDAKSHTVDLTFYPRISRGFSKRGLCIDIALPLGLFTSVAEIAGAQ